METENMDSFSDFYDLIEEGGTAKLKDQAEIGEDGCPTLGQLDPSVELSLDLQELIESAAGKPLGDTNLQLFPELAPCQEVDSIKRDQNQPTESICTTETPLQAKQSTEHVLSEGEIKVPVNTTCPVFTVTESDLVALGLNPSGGDTYIKLDPVSKTGQVVSVVSPTSAGVSSTDENEHTKAVRGTTSRVSPYGSTGRRRALEKGTEEYREKRDRNNIAVRKSRDKAKLRQRHTEERVKELTALNEQLQKKVDLLSKELAVLKGLFTNVGARIPEGLGELLK